MNNKNESLPCYILDDNQIYKFISDYKDPERKDVECEYVDNTILIILPIESILNEYYVINDIINQIPVATYLSKIHYK